MIAEYISFGVALIAILFALSCYHELYKWSRQCQGARIVLSYKNKVRLQATLLEWMLWANMLDELTDVNGRIVYQAKDTAVAILRKPDRRKPMQIIRSLIRRRKGMRRAAPPHVRDMMKSGIQ